MILAAGRGERMRPLTDHMPKPLLPVGGKPLISWHLERLVAAGFEEIIINHAYLGDQIESTLGNGNVWGLSIEYSREGIALETAGGIAYAMPMLGDMPFLVVNGDVYTEMNFSALPVLQDGMLAHLVMVDNPPQHVSGDFGLMDKKITLKSEQKLTYSGIGIYHPDLFKNLVRGEAAKLAPLLKSAIADGLVSGQYFDGVWHDIGTPERLYALDARLTSTTHSYKRMKK